MGLSGKSTEVSICGCYDLHIEKILPGDKVIALGGNPNVGKSTVFNSLTGLKQHTGNWPGKTVVNAQGKYRYKDNNFILVDIPGTYSLMANSAEEEVARDFICFGGPDAAVVVADATCLERNLNLVLQIMEITSNLVLCVNLMDEAQKKKISIDLELLSSLLGIPVVGTSARSGRGLDDLMESISSSTGKAPVLRPPPVTYGDTVEAALAMLEPAVENTVKGCINSRWVSLRLLEGDSSLLVSLKEYLGYDILDRKEIMESLSQATGFLEERGISQSLFRDRVVTCIVKTCEHIAGEVVTMGDRQYHARDYRIDKILTSRLTGIPVMVLMLFGILWVTITGANVPSSLLADGFFSLIEPLSGFLGWISVPAWLSELLVDGVYKTLAWVISVMLPPMAIFFPLFTLLEDLGYLPRVAFNLDNLFRKACTHGKQALTM